MATEAIEQQGHSQTSVPKNQTGHSVTKSTSIHLYSVTGQNQGIGGGMRASPSPEQNTRTLSTKHMPGQVKVSVQPSPISLYPLPQQNRYHKYQSPLSTLLEEQQMHRITRTNQNKNDRNSH